MIFELRYSINEYRLMNLDRFQIGD